MPFMVIYRTADGTTRYEQSDAIDQAALFVERLRNTDGTDDVRIFRMEEISFAFRPYYKVELGMPQRRRTDGEVGPAPAAAPDPIDSLSGRSEIDEGAETREGRRRSDGPALDTTSATEDRPSVAASPPAPAVDGSVEGDVDGARRGLFGR